MIEGEDGIEKLYKCPKCDEILILTGILPRYEFGSSARTNGTATDAFDLFKIGQHIEADSYKTAPFDDDHGFQIVVIGCKNCGHIFGMVPSGAKSIGEDVSGIWKTLSDEIEGAKFGLVCMAKGMLAELRRLQFPETGDEEDEHQQQVVEVDEKVLDPEKPDWQEIAKRTTETLAAVAESAIERQLTKAADRLASSMANSIATAVASVVDKRLAALEQRLASQGTEKKQGSPIPVRIVEVDPEAVIRVEDDGREREVRVTNTPLDVRQLPG